MPEVSQNVVIPTTFEPCWEFEKVPARDQGPDGDPDRSLIGYSSIQRVKSVFHQERLYARRHQEIGKLICDRAY